MVVPQVPNELVECILDNLYFDKNTLLSCALVANAWVTPSQRGIFRLITLKPPHSEYGNNFSVLFRAYLKTNSLLIASFNEKPYLASYVRALELIHFPTVLQPTPNVSPLWKALCTSTTRVIRHLSNVESILFKEFHWHSITISPLLEEALVNILKAPSLTRIFLHDFLSTSDLTSLLAYPAHLKALKVEWAKYPQVEPTLDNTTKAAPQSIQLDQLLLQIEQKPFHTFDDLVDWFQHKACPFDLRHLRSLQIYHSRLDHHRAAYLLQQAGGNLRELELQGLYPNEKPLDVLHLGYTSKLHTLKLSRVFQTELYSPIPWIHSLFQPFLDSDRNICSLRHLTVELYTNPQAIPQLDQWALFDALLEKPQFSSLEVVNIMIVGMAIMPSSVTESLSEKLLFLNQSGKLKVTFSLHPMVGPQTPMVIYGNGLFFSYQP
ncbi:hypothetical protein BT96DRAFT_918090 [Gymnopus androsaceus JB14]|uniref:F-box domain-containing protein n=1 Tax=Gymnopus androsaceus JB14 TaxID=1447944 RepID=A0A6A4I196_9AGAR|nr:hypothetical protein BT96DRAFT_918090 [Gymnopus androsaceus JB14]